MEKYEYAENYRPLFAFCEEYDDDVELEYGEAIVDEIDDRQRYAEKMFFLRAFNIDTNLYDGDDEGEIDYMVELVAKKAIYEYNIELSKPNILTFYVVKMAIQNNWFNERELFVRLLAAAEMAS